MSVALVKDPKTEPISPAVCSVTSASLLRRYEEAERVVVVDGESIRLNVEKMELNRFYFVELKGQPYVIRKVNEDVVDVYGLVEKG